MPDVGDLIVDVLEATGVTAVFGVPGGQTLPLYRAARSRGFAHVLMRDERNAACAADAYARVSGRVGVCDATVGPGTTNLISGLAEAYTSSVPVLAIVADIRANLEHLRNRSVASQSIDQAALLRPIVKWFGRVPSVGSAADVLDQALRVATTGRPGPVCIEIPEEVFAADLGDALLRSIDPGAALWPRHRPAPDPERLAEAASLINNARRPVILAGGGAVASGAGPELAALAEAARIPIVTTINGKGTIDERAPLAFGVVGAFGSPVAGGAVRDADVVVVAGSKLDQLSTFNWKIPHAGQSIIHIDIDGEEIGRAVPVAVPIVADVRQTVTALRALVTGPGPRPPVVRPALPDGPNVDDRSRIDPRLVIEGLNDLLGEGDLFVTDASLSSGWSSAGYEVKSPGRGFLAPRGLAGIGWAAGAAIGARMAAAAGSRVVALVGDGAWGYQLGEVETAVRNRHNITFVILNNAGFGWVVHGEKRGGVAPESSLGDADYAAAARALGAMVFQVHDSAEVATTLEEALAHDGPTLVEVKTSLQPSPIIGMRRLVPAAGA